MTLDYETVDAVHRAVLRQLACCDDDSEAAAYLATAAPDSIVAVTDLAFKALRARINLAARPAPERAEPGDLVDARQDPVHRDVGVSRPACVSRILPCPTCGEAWGRPADHALPLPVAICAVCGHSHGGHGVDDNGAYCTVEGCDCTAYDEIARTP